MPNANAGVPANTALPVAIAAGLDWELLALAGVAMLAVLVMFSLLPLDLVVQDWIFAAGGQAWPIVKSDHLLRMAFYRAPKVALVLFGAGLILALAASYRLTRLARYRRAFWYLALVLALVPALAALGKHVTNVRCPAQLSRYGGAAPYVRLLSSQQPVRLGVKPGRCFPAGHASGGYALISLGFVFAGQRRRAWGAALGLGLGSAMGLYQMAIGAHFLSHTLVSALLAVVVSLSLRPVLGHTRRDR